MHLSNQKQKTLKKTSESECQIQAAHELSCLFVFDMKTKIQSSLC